MTKEYTVVTKTEFDSMYKEHLLWLENPKQGSQLKLLNCDLNTNNINLDDLNLSNIKFENVTIGYKAGNTNFTNAYLSNCNFRETNISGADFENATIINNDFEDVELGYSNFTNAYVLNCKFTGDIPKHLEIAISKTSDKVLTLSQPKTLKIPFKNNKQIQKIGTQLSQGLEITLAKKSSEIIANNTKKALVAAKIPKSLINHPLFNALISISAPHLLRILLPQIPQLNKNTNVIKLLELACQGAVTSVTTETLEYVINQTLPILKQLESPKMKEIVGVMGE